jgi:hypothetical protein
VGGYGKYNIAFSIIRFCRLSENGGRCGGDGLTVGPTPPLARAASGGWDRKRYGDMEH